MLLGIICEANWSAERIVSMKAGDKVSLGGYELTFERLTSRTGPNFREAAASFIVRSNGDEIGTMQPAKRTFASRGTTTTEAALLTRGFSQLYASLGDQRADGALAVRLYYKPLVLLIWLGPVLMAFGGALSLSDRRLRVGAPKPAKPRIALQPAE
jgi:cytochrome c-type biogenesis protein CcmF